MGIKGKNDKMVVLACEDCKERNYTTTKNKKNIKERLELSKYCPKCKKHTNHKETKQRERAEAFAGVGLRKARQAGQNAVKSERARRTLI